MNQRVIGNLLLVFGSIGIAIYAVIFLLLGLTVISPVNTSRQESFAGTAVLDAVFSPLLIIGIVMVFVGLRFRRLPSESKTIGTDRKKDLLITSTAGSITYSPVGASNVLPFAFMGIGLMFVVLGVVFTLVVVFIVPPIALVTLLFSLFGLAFVALGGWRWYANRGQRLLLNPNALISLNRRNSVRLQLADICAVSAREATYWAKDPLSQIDLPVEHRYWIVRIETSTGAYLDLEVTQDGYLGLFDVVRVLRDLRPRVPTTAVIDPRIQTYLATGRLTME